MNDINYQPEIQPNSSVVYANCATITTTSPSSSSSSSSPSPSSPSARVRASVERQPSEQDQIVTSTSSETVSQQQHHHHHPDIGRATGQLAASVRITSSSGNACGKTPQHVPAVESSQDGAQSPRQRTFGAALESQRVEIRRAVSTNCHRPPHNGAMPTTSVAAVAAVAADTVSTVAAASAADALSSCGRLTRKASPTTHHTHAKNGKTTHRASGHAAEMVAREIVPTSVADSGCGAGGNSGSSSAPAVAGQHGPPVAQENHKIILKLPKPTPAPPDESHMDADPTTSSCSSSSNSCSAEETRKVEPLKINLNAHHHSPNVVPKITIKPIFKQTESDCSSSAEDDVAVVSAANVRGPKSPIPKLTIKSSTVSSATTTAAPTDAANEPHIVPKLTIRSGNEDGGPTHSSVVPKLTIKMSDHHHHHQHHHHHHHHAQQSPSLTHSTHTAAPAASALAAASSTTTLGGGGSVAGTTALGHGAEHTPPPLPKLTIKTSLDGTSESIISTLSPASPSSSSSSSLSSISALASTSVAASTFLATSSSSSAAATSCISSAAPATVPKLTIKTVLKPEETVPKLTIKTNASGTCVSTSAEEHELVVLVADGPDNGAVKIPKLTIKTGQEHAVIITQHNDAANAQSVPKLTIKTKSLEAEESLSDRSEEPPPEKIPKITIKTHELTTTTTEATITATKFCIKAQPAEGSDCTPTAIPKLTISVSNLEGGYAPMAQSPKQSPLVVRQMAASAGGVSASPERVPKLMISRQDAVSHCDYAEKSVPKLTIKTNSLECSETKEKLSLFTIKSHSTQEDEKALKLTIKPNPVVVVAQQQQRHMSDDSDESMSVESLPLLESQPQLATANKVVPKLTIKNLSSPKLKMRAVLEMGVDAAETASKKSAKSGDTRSAIDLPNATASVEPASGRSEQACTSTTRTTEPAVNGESSNSVEFCGFNDNTTESAVDTTTTTPTTVGAADGQGEEPRRNSDDMDIDEGLQQRDPQVFNNASHFAISNGDDHDCESDAVRPAHQHHHPLSRVIDTVDLTSSPSPGSSPAHFNCPGAEPPRIHAQPLQQQLAPTPALFMERLQRETSVIKSVAMVEDTHFLLNQLTMPSNGAATSKYGAVVQPQPPPLQPKPLQHPIHPAFSSANKYPQLTERLLANGAHMHHMSDSGPQSAVTAAPAVIATTAPTTATAAAAAAVVSSQVHNDVPKPPQAVIESIEILDTPEGSPRPYHLDEAPVQLNNHFGNHVNVSPAPYDSDHMVDTRADVLRRNNNNNTMDHHAATTASAAIVNHVHLKRHVDSSDAQEQAELKPNKLRRMEQSRPHMMSTMATLTIMTDDKSSDGTLITTSPTFIESNHCLAGDVDVAECVKTSPSTPQKQHRSRKQRHENLLSVPIEEEVDPLQLNPNDILATADTPASQHRFDEAPAATPVATAPTPKRRGRPKKRGPKPKANAANTNTTTNNSTTNATTNTTTTTNIINTTTTSIINATTTNIINATTTSNATHTVSALGEAAPPNAAVLSAPTRAPAAPITESSAAESTPEKGSKTRRVQLLRKRLAIDMVSAEQPALVDDLGGGESTAADTETPRRDRTLRNSRRSATPNVLAERARAARTFDATPKTRKRGGQSTVDGGGVPSISNHFGGSNSSISSACSSSSMCSSTVTTTTLAAAMAASASSSAAQIDLTMSSSCSSAGSIGSAIAAANAVNVAIAAAQSRGGGSNSMLPPATILSSSDPVPDVVFKPNDFSCIMATQQLRSPNATLSRNGNGSGSRTDSQDEDVAGGSGADNSGEDSNSSSSVLATPSGRGRGRGRGARSGAGRGGAAGSASSQRGQRGHRLGRGASAVAKAIALSRPRCVGGLKHTPDPGRIKGLFSPSPQVFEEDTRMSADLSLSQVSEPPTPFRQPDFCSNDESQSSMVSNNSILDPNTVSSVQNGSAIKPRPKKKKMEICTSDDMEFTVASIAEYDWPPPKGCCPSKNRDTFMIQEQVALFLGIKSFKRKYPDLPRRQVDMEERNWLQEKQLVSEKMCDLGITAVWASDILDIMYTDFADKYEQYKDFIRQKHLRDIETKQRALGLNVTGRGLQARDRAMLSASKWNAYFNRSRKEERVCCLDLQTLTVNVPLPATAPSATLVSRSIAEAVAVAAKETNVPEPPTLLSRRVFERLAEPDDYYPLTLVPEQFSANYRDYTPSELRSLPLNTVLEDPSLLCEHVVAPVADDTDSDEATEAAEDGASSLQDDEDGDVAAGSDSSATKQQRVPVRRSRRARKNAAAERAKAICDTSGSSSGGAAGVNGKFALADEKLPLKAMLSTNSSSESGSSESSNDNSSTETDSEAEHSASSSSAAPSSSSSDDDDAETPAACGVCLRSAHRNLRDMPELFIRCYTCRRKVHPSCIEMPHRMVARVRNYNWQCADCKCCIRCRHHQDQNKMLFCEQCDRGYHIYCLDVKAVPEGRWSCERCSVCMRCGATKPDGLPLQQLISPSGERIRQIKHKKVKWINEYRIDHITKLREHCSMLCVPCARTKTPKRVLVASIGNTGPIASPTPQTANDGNSISPGPSSDLGPTLQVLSPSPTTIGDGTSSDGAVSAFVNQPQQEEIQQNNETIESTTSTTVPPPPPTAAPPVVA